MPFVLNEGIFSSSDSLSLFLSSWQGNSDVLWTKQRTVGENVKKCFTLLYSASLTCGGQAGYKREARRGWVSWVQTLIHFVHNPSHRYCVSNNCYSNYAKNVRGKIRKHITYFLQTCKLNPTPISDMMEFKYTFFADYSGVLFLSGYVKKDTSKVFSTLI